MKFNEVFYEAEVLEYPLGKLLKDQYQDIPWTLIESHNNIKAMQAKENKDFPEMKRNLIIGTRKTHKYLENQKVSDFLVPYTSSGCTAMCLYCYLVCNYNKCAYLRVFVNREQMMDRLLKQAHRFSQEKTFEIGSNSDLILENTITKNLEWTIPLFAKEGRGKITFPSKFNMVEPLLSLDHKGSCIFRMSVNPTDIIKQIELGTSSLEKRIQGINQMAEADYPVGILIAPVIFVDDWKIQYRELLTLLAETLTAKAKKQLFVEIILMTYSYIHRAINQEAFPDAPDLYNPEQMRGRGRGRYAYQQSLREEAETFFQEELGHKLPDSNILYIS